MNNTLSKKILFIGPIEPPAGGISVHIKRLSNLLENDFQIDFIDESTNKKDHIYNIRNGNVFLYLFKIYKSDLIFIHSGSILLKKIHIIVAKIFNKKSITTFHGFGKYSNNIKRWINSKLYNLSSKIIVVNPDLIHFSLLPIHKTFIRPAYIPPILSKEPSLPSYIEDILQFAKTQNKIVICSNASRLNFHNNEDLYGLDMCIELARELQENNIEFVFVFIVSSSYGASNYIDDSCRKIDKYGLSNTFYLLNDLISFVKLIEQSDIFIRATNTDGDAISIREALFLNKIIIASDIVKRPSNTKLFKSRNQCDLNNVCMNVIKNELTNKSINEIDTFNSINENYLFYKNILTNVLAQ